MPEYLAPGVYVEETSFRPKTIEGVGTSTAGFVGATRYGPVSGEPELLTSFLDFERIYGGLDPLHFDGEEPSTNHLAHGVRAFFENGGRRLYVSRVHTPVAAEGASAANAEGRADTADAPLPIEARHPGAAGNVTVRFDLQVGPNALRGEGGAPKELRGVSRYDAVYVLRAADGDSTPAAEDAYWVDERPAGKTVLRKQEGDPEEVLELDGLTNVTVHPVTVSVTVGAQGRFGTEQTWEGLGLHPEHRSSITRVFAREPAGRLTELYAPLIIDAPGIDADSRLRSLADAAEGLTAAEHVRAVIENVQNPGQEPRRPGRPPAPTYRLTGGSDGSRPDAAAFAGREIAPGRRTGLNALEDLDDIAIVAAPGATAVADVAGAQAAMQRLVGHAERMRYRIAVLDPPPGQTVGEVRDFRGVFDSSHAALYYPWIVTDDPMGRAAGSSTPAELTTPPSGFIAGIYARNDTERGVHKAPANEIVRLAKRFEFPLNTAQQEVLNPIGVNCLRFFEGRGHRVWGARTATSDPEWKYVNLRRYFAYAERSVERATQWAVFEPNGSLLWGQVRRAVEDFLFNELANRHLAGTSPEEAYFVRCDLSTMSQNDLDNGRMVCLVGIAPLRPAEFVIFRIGQKTLDARG